VQQQVVQARRALLTSRVNLFAALGSDSDAFAVAPETQTNPIQQKGRN